MRYAVSYLIVPLLALSACSTNGYKHSSSAEATAEQAYAATADSTVFATGISSPGSPSRKRVRSADVRCRVNNVFQAASQLEHAVTAVNGIVAESNLKNENVQQHELPYSSDSLKRIMLYTPTASLTLKVPVEHLDAVVHTLTSIAGFIDYRILRDEDLTLKYLSNSLKNDQLTPGGNIIPGKKTSTLDIEKYSDQKKENAVDRSIANLEILGDVAYSTFTVQLFQPEVADVQIVLNPDHVARAGFGTEILSAVRSGATLLRNIILLLVQIWPFVIALAIGWFGYRKLRH
ncbi:MAG TPA: DUF4349 domain-containing protein [Chitinophaga sp.]|uniref:DUF4349 domain-containing protein n=1 Tax=Chitinophaga sp. TaxID=1869181 RepID=UPI002B90A4AB|nr:DUF4349 domain-containing protein [Chitinophaga sp.]HVI46430.1 DUF4349 domain-containing protein [Chitinophaga sp.]